jgi:NitT/TauT family transport system permease protein
VFIPSLNLLSQLIVDTAYSWLRMSFALILSILFSWAVGITAARNRTAERIILPVLDVLQSIPILGFFPVVLVLFVDLLPGMLGINMAVVFLIFTSMSWNIAFGVYESVKSIPEYYLDLASLERIGVWKRITTLYIPASWARVAYNSVTSWSVGLFYLVSSEIFSLGSRTDEVQHGIGVDIATFAGNGLWNQYVTAILILIFAVLLTRVFFLSQFVTWSEKFKLGEDSRMIKKDPIYKLYSWFNLTARQRLFSTLAKRTKRIPKLNVTPRAPPNSWERIAKVIKYVVVAILLVAAGVGAVSVLPQFIAGNIVLKLAAAAKDESIVAEALAFSFVRVWYVYIIAVAISLPLGIAIATNKRLFDISTPILQVVSAVPAPALLPPLAIAFSNLPFGGEMTAMIVILLGMLWYLLFNIISGVRTIPSEVIEMATLSRLSKWEAWKNVYIPAALPAFITGSITAVGGAWNTLIVAEYFNISLSGASGAPLTQVGIGIGKLIDIADLQGNLLLLGLSILSMSALVVTFNILVWRRLYNRTTKRYVYNR